MDGYYKIYFYVEESQIARWSTWTALARQQERQTPRTWRAKRPAERRVTRRKLTDSQEEKVATQPSVAASQELGTVWSVSVLGLVVWVSCGEKCFN